MEAERDQLSPDFSDLPNHIVTEILSRLPLKTVVAAKCVCKPWLNLVSTDTHLAESHRRRSATTELLLRPAASPKLYLGNLRFQDQLVTEVKHSPLFELPVFDLTNDNSIIWGKTERNSIEFVNYRNRIEFANSCNGLVCFRSGHFSSIHAVIINPVTGEFITVPMSTKWKKRDATVDYGLGFSVKENRFKLLQLTNGSKRSAEICTFEKGSSSWRDVGDCPYKFSASDSVFLEGKLHFRFGICLTIGDGIAYFDFEKERFGLVPIPSRFGVQDHESSFGVLNGCLFVSRFAACGYETWVMKEYGVRNSWEKVFCVRYDLLPNSGDPVPVKQLDNGEILLLYVREYFVSYNPSANSIVIVGRDADTIIGVSAYSPTLLRLKDALAGHEACIHDVNSRRRILTQSHKVKKFGEKPKKPRLKF